MLKSLQPSVAVMKWPAQAEDLGDLSSSAGQHMPRRRRNLSGAKDHQQPHNHQNLICYVHKSHAGLDS